MKNKSLSLLAAAITVFCSFAGFAEGDWRVSVNGAELPLRTCRASVWAPYQFGSFEVKGGEEVVVTAPDGKVEKFSAEKPFKRIFDPLDRKSVLILFGDAPETDVPDRNDPKVKWFGPGEHKTGGITLNDGETLYLARGAVVHGGLYARGRDITVTGRGILTGVDYPKCKGPFLFFTYFDHCTNLVIRGVTLTEPYHWTLAVSQSRKVLIDDVRLCCGNIINDDGIDLMNSSEVTIRDTFVRTQDDAIAIKGQDPRPPAERSPCEDILVENSTLWVDAANVFRIGYESNASAFRRFTFRSIDVHAYSPKCKPVSNYWSHAIVWLQPSNGLRISDLLFEDLRVRSNGTDLPLVIAEPRVTRCFFPGNEHDPYTGKAQFEYYKTGGSVENVTFRRMSVAGERGAFRGTVHAQGRSPTETVCGLRFEDCTRLGAPLTARSPDVTIGAFAEAEFIAGDAYDAYLEAKATWTGKPDATKLRKAFFKETFGAGCFNMDELFAAVEKFAAATPDAREIGRLQWLVRDALSDVGVQSVYGQRVIAMRKRLVDPLAAKTDGIRDGVHDYQTERYQAPTNAAVVAALEAFRDRKLALMMHFGIYSQLGIHESWPLVDAEAKWSRKLVDWTDGEAFKREYWSMIRSFNPVRFQPDVWADLAARNGFRYVIFTTKHHDGFCMFDSKYSDYKVTSPVCPFSTHPKADITRAVFDAFRAKGLSVSCYFSKPDWHHPDYWDNCGLGYKTDRMPSYDVEEDSARWARYRAFVRNQILELISGYGPIDCLWLDGGQVQPKTGLDINIEEIVTAARKIQPGLIAVDRAVGNSCEDVITPEQTVPEKPLPMPWESCITMGTGFSYRYDETFKDVHSLIHLLIDVVAKGGNLALNVAPGPDGRLPAPAVERMDAMGRWLKANGAAIYATRVCAPYRTGDWAFTQGKDNGPVYAIRLWKEGEKGVRRLVLPADFTGKVASVVHLASGLRAPAETRPDGTVSFELPDGAWADAVADAFRVE